MTQHLNIFNFNFGTRFSKMKAFKQQQQNVQVAKAAVAVVRFEERAEAKQYHNDFNMYDTVAFQGSESRGM